MLYPTELLRLISKIFNFSPSTDSNELPLRRRVLYPLSYGDMGKSGFPPCAVRAGRRFSMARSVPLVKRKYGVLWARRWYAALWARRTGMHRMTRCGARPAGPETTGRWGNAFMTKATVYGMHGRAMTSCARRKTPSIGRKNE